jgi:hypothetical protein
LEIDVRDPCPAIYLDHIRNMLRKGTPVGDSLETGRRDVILDINTVRNMGMIIDPFFLLELKVNGVTPKIVFSISKEI